MALIRYYMVSIQEPISNRNSTQNGTNNAIPVFHGFCDEQTKAARRSGQSFVVLFSELGTGVDAYQLELGQKTRYDVSRGIQVLSPRALQLALMRLEGDTKMSQDVSLFLNPATKEILVRHARDQRSVDRVQDAGTILEGLSRANIVNRLEGHNLGRADSQGILLAAFGGAGGPPGQVIQPAVPRSPGAVSLAPGQR